MPNYDKMGEWAKNTESRTGWLSSVATNLAEAFPEAATEKNQIALVHHFSEIASAISNKDDRSLASAQEGLRAFLAPIMQELNSPSGHMGDINTTVNDITAYIRNNMPKGRIIDK